MNSLLNGIVFVIEKMTALLWGDLLRIPLPGGSTLGLSPLVLLLIPAGIYYTLRTKFLPIRMFREMLSVLIEKPDAKMQGDLSKGKLSGLQTLIVSTATRVGMGNLVGVVAAISGGGAGAVRSTAVSVEAPPIIFMTFSLKISPAKSWKREFRRKKAL